MRNLAEREIAAATRHGQSLILLMLDLDHFKKINDEYGHAAGDEALRPVTATLRSRTRHEDVLSRIGGEEFVILLTHTDLEMGVGTAQRLRAAVEAIALSVSIGLAKWRRGESLERLLQRADVALYRAKEAGRNCVMVAEETPSATTPVA